jgi:hypothetical protein
MNPKKIHHRAHRDHRGACKFLCVTDLGVVSNEETTDEPEEEDEEQS